MTADDPQAEVFAFLSDPATHGMMFADEEVKRIDTHAAVVFLAGSQAFKVKRSVRYPFLDFSTLANRKAAGAPELAVNRASRPSSTAASCRSPARSGEPRSRGAARRSNGGSRWRASDETATSIIGGARRASI
jgi:hypothetical protein